MASTEILKLTTEDENRAALVAHAEILRGLIRQENDITNQRTTWLLVSQGILLAAAGSFLKIHLFPTIVVGIVGLLLSLSFGKSLENSFEARQYLKQSWRTLVEKQGFKWEDFPPLDGGVPGVRVVRWSFPWYVAPRVFVVAWAVLILFFAIGNYVAI